MEIKKEMIHRQLAGDNILVPGGNAVLDLNGLFVMTETGAFIWSVLPDAETEEDVVNKMLEEYDVDRETAQQDVKEFLDRLRIYGIID
ncbi:MAG: PqqD family protein [Clostridia bacterium]|nr:PqqD family protein [Clostridia bacterium]